MVKVTIATDADKAQLAAQYQMVMTRAQEIKDDAATMTLAQAKTAIGDLASGFLIITPIVKKLVQREL